MLLYKIFKTWISPFRRESAAHLFTVAYALLAGLLIGGCSITYDVGLKDIIGWFISLFIGVLVTYTINKVAHTREKLAKQLEKKKDSLHKQWAKVNQALVDSKEYVDGHLNNLRTQQSFSCDQDLVDKLEKMDQDWRNHLSKFANNKSQPFTFVDHSKYPKLTTREHATDNLWVKAANNFTISLLHLIEVCKIEYTSLPTRTNQETRKISLSRQSLPTISDYDEYLTSLYSAVIEHSEAIGDELALHISKSKH